MCGGEGVRGGGEDFVLMSYRPESLVIIIVISFSFSHCPPSQVTNDMLAAVTYMEGEEELAIGSFLRLTDADSTNSDVVVDLIVATVAEMGVAEYLDVNITDNPDVEVS